MKHSALLLGFSFLLSKILGLVRDNLLAAGFGASADLDLYYAAFRLPDLLFNLLSYGVLSAAFVPLFLEIRERDGKPRAFEFTNEILRTVGGAVLILSIILYFLAPRIIIWFVPGFSENQLNITADLTRIMLITPAIFTVGAIAGGVQNAYHAFFGIAAAPILYNLGIIGGIVGLSDSYGVYGIAIGVASGAFLNMAVQLPGMLRLGFRFRWPKTFLSVRVKEMIRLSLPRIFGMSVAQLSLVVDTVIASTLAAGSISAINFASNIESVPVGLIGVTLAVVSFGTLSELVAQNRNQEFIQTLRVNIRRILFLLIPITFGMATLRFQIVRLLLGRGKFGWEATAITANTLGIFLSGLLFGGLVFLLARGFYALKNTKTPVACGILAVIVNIVASLVFTKIFPLGPYGLAIANSLADIVNAALLIIFLSRELKTSLLNAKEIGKFILAGLIMVFAVQAVKLGFGEIFEDIDTYFELAIQTGTAIGVGALTYFGSSYILRT